MHTIIFTQLSNTQLSNTQLSIHTIGLHTIVHTHNCPHTIVIHTIVVHTSVVLPLTRSIEENGLSLPRKCSRSHQVFGRVLFGRKSQNSAFSAPMARFMIWRRHHQKNLTQIHSAYCQTRWWISHNLGLFRSSKSRKSCVLDRIMHRFYYRDILEQNRSTILYSGDNTTTYMIMIRSIPLN